MLGDSANEFTPLLPAVENQQARQDIGFRGNATEDLDTAPLPLQTDETDRRLSRTSDRGLLGRGSRDEAISSAIDDGYEENDLVRQRSRLNSYPVVVEPEFTKRKDDVNITAVLSRSSGTEESQSGGSDPNSKYTNVGPLRFWCVFITVLLGEWKQVNFNTKGLLTDQLCIRLFRLLF